jgi:hypothetical protein
MLCSVPEVLGSLTFRLPGSVSFVTDPDPSSFSAPLPMLSNWH